MELLATGPSDASLTVALAHGAGAAMDSPFMDVVAMGLARRGVRVVRFEFPYMRERRLDGRRRPPDGLHRLKSTWNEVIDALGAERLIVGGKSMGGRIASMIADERAVSGLVCLGYPFHPPGQPTKRRIAHLAALETPTLIVQGTRDPFGTRSEVTEYPLSDRIELRWIEDGDHSLKPRVRSGRTLDQNLAEAVDAVAAFVATLAD